MRVKINKNLVALIAGSADSTPCLQAHPACRHTLPAGTLYRQAHKRPGRPRMVTAPAYRLISTSKLVLAVYWRKRP